MGRRRYQYCTAPDGRIISREVVPRDRVYSHAVLHQIADNGEWVWWSWHTRRDLAAAAARGARHAGHDPIIVPVRETR